MAACWGSGTLRASKDEAEVALRGALGRWERGGQPPEVVGVVGRAGETADDGLSTVDLLRPRHTGVGRRA